MIELCNHAMEPAWQLSNLNNLCEIDQLQIDQDGEKIVSMGHLAIHTMVNSLAPGRCGRD